jgi:hypothetical protein
MRKPIRIVAIVILLTFTGTMMRWWHVANNSLGAGGGGVFSPDEKLVAEAASFEVEKFWGGKCYYYEFSIRATNGNVICKNKLDLDKPHKPLSNYYGDSAQLIIWDTNSSSVIYNFNGGHLTLSVTP